MPEVITNNLGFLLQGLATTVVLSTWTLVGGTLLGLVVAIVRYRRVPLLGPVAALYVEIIRGTPLLVVLFVTYFALPALLGYRSTAERAAIIGFILFIGAYLAEDIRAGLLAVRPGLIAAGLATGLTQAQVLRLIVLPQALRNVTPVLFNQYVRLFKFTSVASVIGVNELTGSALLVNAREFQPVAIMAFLAATYLVCCYAISLVGRILYARLVVARS